MIFFSSETLILRYSREKRKTIVIRENLRDKEVRLNDWFYLLDHSQTDITRKKKQVSKN